MVSFHPGLQTTHLVFQLIDRRVNGSIEVVIANLGAEIHLFSEDSNLDLRADLVGTHNRAAENFVGDNEVLIHPMQLLLDVTTNSIGDLDVLADNLIFHWLCSSGGL